MVILLLGQIREKEARGVNTMSVLTAGMGSQSGMCFLRMETPVGSTTRRAISVDSLRPEYRFELQDIPSVAGPWSPRSKGHKV